jgi:hypothetical protein
VLEDASDDMLFGWIKQSKALFSSADAGNRFTVLLVETTALPLPQPSWRERRKLHHQAAKPTLPQPETPLSAACLPPPSSTTLPTQFLRSFNPAESARPLIPQLSLPHTLVLDGVDLTKLYACPSIARVLVNYVFNINFTNEPIIVDTGASVCITPHADDFKPGSYRPSTIKVKDLSGTNHAAGEGIIQWSVTDDSGNTRLLEVPGVHLDFSAVQLLSPQVLLQESSSTMSMDSSAVTFHLPYGPTLCAPIDKASNLPQLPL